ncbi:unnamed protein product [Caretta caretta]
MASLLPIGNKSVTWSVTIPRASQGLARRELRRCWDIKWCWSLNSQAVWLPPNHKEESAEAAEKGTEAGQSNGWLWGSLLQQLWTPRCPLPGIAQAVGFGFGSTSL